MFQEICKYTPYYCEENIWHLCRDPRFRNSAGFVVFISNPAKQCFFYKQRMGGTGDPVIWDYHVIFLTCENECLVWDLDTLLPFPCLLSFYLSETFPGPLPEWVSPFFKFIPAAEYIEDFYSDRSHMREGSGAYIQPPPYWPPIKPEKGNSLDGYISMHGKERIWSLNELAGGIWCFTP